MFAIREGKSARNKLKLNKILKMLVNSILIPNFAMFTIAESPKGWAMVGYIHKKA